MIARIDLDSDTPIARIKNDVWKTRIKSIIDDGIADILTDALKGDVRIDRLLVLFQHLLDSSSIYAKDFFVTERLLHTTTVGWINTVETHKNLWWEVAPICVIGRVQVKVKSLSNGVYAIAEDGNELEGVLGSWLVDEGHGFTTVDKRLGKIDIQLLVRFPTLIRFV